MAVDIGLRDALTGAHSRATLQERLREEVERARRYDLPLSLIIADLDHFKSINDAFGHTRGDVALIGFVERLRALIRDSDLLFRYGGDEFVMLLLHTDRHQALILAGRLLDGIRATPFAGNPPLSMTLSIGSASFPEDGQTPEDLFECADRRLYEAKRHGRDRVVVEDPMVPAPLTFEAGSRVMERELPLATLRQFFDQLHERKHGALSISGPFASGKTWFLAEAIKIARLRGFAVWTLEGRPALHSRVFGAAAVAKPLGAGLPPPAAGERVFIRAVQAYLSDEGKAGMILAVDNLAELDRDTFDLLRHLLFAAEIPVVALIYTVDPAGAYSSSPLEAPLEVRVELRPLSVLGVRLWLRSVLRWEAPEEFCQWLHRETDGLPGQLQTGLTHLMHEQVLQPREAGWSLAAPYETVHLRSELARLARAPASNLPATSAGFVGRDEELQLLTQWLANEPLITVVGPGGIGKSRLALQAAAECLERFRDGVFLVPLSSVTTLDFMVSSIAQTAGLALAGAEAAAEQLLGYLANLEMLLILDDFEYRLNASTLLAEIRQRAPKLRLLITARDRLDVPGEVTLELRGLPVPPAATEAARGGALPASRYSAEQLYLLAARRAAPEFSLGDEDRLYVRRICQLVDGMPLGIELAAAWTPLFSSRDIAAQIERNVDFLATSRADIPERQRSTRAVLDYFWSLLAEDERRRIRGLSVFRGGFEREAGLEVADASLFFLSALVDKAFLRKLPSGRYEMHELLRQYAELSLGDLPGERMAASDRHCRYYAQFIQRRQTPAKGGEQAAALSAINADISNVRAAWEWAITNGRADRLREFFDGLVVFYDTQNWYHEGAEIFVQALETWRARQASAEPAEEPDATLARLLVGQGIFCHRLGLNGRAGGALEASLNVISALPAGDLLSEKALALYFLGLARQDLGDYEAAQGLLRDSLELRRDQGDRHGMAQALDDLAGVAHHLGDYAEARELYAESLQLRRDIGDQHGVAQSLSHAGELALDLGEYGQAQTILDEIAESSRALGQRWANAYSLHTLGLLADARGDYEAANRHLGASLNFNRENGNSKEITHDLLGMAEVALHAGEFGEARRLNDESLAVSRQNGYRRGMVLALIGLGNVASVNGAATDGPAFGYFEEALRMAMTVEALPWMLSAVVGIAAVWDQSGRREEAVQLLTLAVYHPACNRRTQQRAARLLSRLETELPPAQVAQAEELGRRRPLDEAVRTVLAAGHIPASPIS